MTDQITALCHSVEKDAAAWRRYLHEHPELGFHEVETTRFIEEKLRSFGGIEIWKPTPTGVVGILKGAKPGKTAAFRADIDALPIQECAENNPRSQTAGVMHACGHDAHTATLLGAAAVLSSLRDTLEGEIRFIFQPAEEAHPGGAAALVAAGVMKGVDCVFGMHYDVPAEPGIFLVKPGPLFAAAYTFDIEITGKDAHAAFPFNGIDSILIASHLVAALNEIIPRCVDNSRRAVLTVTQIHGGNAYNIIPEKVSLGGTIRFLDRRCEETLLERIRTISEGLCAMHSAKCALTFHKGYGMVENTPEAAAAVRQVLENRFGKEQVAEPTPLMGGEDFSAYLQEAPGCYYRAGTRKPKPDGEVCLPHTSRYEFNDESLHYTIEGAVRVLLEAPRLIGG